jgi:hypothetical protein
MMTKNGETIQDYLEIFQHEVSVGCTKHGHRYSQNGTISCIVCGEIKSK